MNNLPATQAAAAPVIDYQSAELRTVLKQTVAKGTTDAEFEMFIGMCQGTGLNPLKKEIWCIVIPETPNRKREVQMMTGINGFYEIANEHPQFDGIETEIVEDKGRIVKAVARAYRKDRSRPMTAEAHAQEYAKPYGNWKTMPRVMLSKCAEAMALRKSFPQKLNGLYVAEEMPREYQVEPQAEPQPESPKINGAPRVMPANERIEADTMPDQYKLEAPKSTHHGKTLAQIHAEDPKWISATVTNENRRKACTQRDIANLMAFWDVMHNARAVCEEEFGGEDAE